jgi:hypothetical protein
MKENTLEEMVELIEELSNLDSENPSVLQLSLLIERSKLLLGRYTRSIKTRPDIEGQSIKNFYCSPIYTEDEWKALLEMEEARIKYIKSIDDGFIQLL